ncbi:MAG: metal ABC transporter substrate-binding protein [Myxococcota bacterium]
MFWIWLACQSTDVPLQKVQAEGPLEVWSLSYPVHYLAQRIGGEQIKLRVLLPEGEDATDWWPTPAQITQLAQSDLVLANGANFESWVNTASLPTGLVVSAAKGFSAIEIEGHTHSHGKGGAHSHAGIDPYVWMDPDIYRLQAKQVTQSLKDRDSEHAELYQSRFEDFSAELDQLITESLPVMTLLKDHAIAANHPVYNYWMRRFELDIRSFDIPSDESPETTDVVDVNAWVSASSNPILFWGATPSDGLQEFLKGPTHLVIDNLEVASSGQMYDYLKQYRANLSRIQASFKTDVQEGIDVP